MRHGHAGLAAPVLFALCHLVSPVFAQPLLPQDVPPPLRPWVGWVLDDLADQGCSRVNGRAVCAWPGRLQLELDAAGGSFLLEAQADRATDLGLPGSAEVWPQEVRLDGVPCPVFTASDGRPAVRLGAGRHRVAGRFRWSRMPESLSVPASIGLVDLRLEARAIAAPRRDSGGLLWLRNSAHGDDAAGSGESVRLQVFRHVSDGVPLFVETRLQLEVAGKSREVTLEGALLPGSVPLEVGGDLPARVENGSLRVQVRGGRYAVWLRARLDGQPKALTRPREAPIAPWPAREVWVFEANETLRQVELSGPPPIDPSRTELPSEWQRLPAFLVDPGGSLALQEVRRGQAAPPPDDIRLSRVMWLDPDGRGATVHDDFTGTLQGTTRVDVLPPAQLGRVALEGQDQLVTSNPDTKATGVEVRRQALSLAADSRLALGGALPAVGWSTAVEQLRITLNVPPGWSLFAARGVDQVAGAWASRWTLLGFFFVLVITFAVLKLFGPRAALLAAATLVLLHGEPGAPFVAWLSLVGAIALRRVVPAVGLAGRLAQVWFAVSAVVLLAMLVPFARDQVKDALFPQTAVEGSLVQISDALSVASGRMDAAPAAPAPGGATNSVELADAQEATELQKENAPSDEVRRSARLRRKADNYQSNVYLLNQALEQDPKAVLQTGPGLPNWSWRSYALSWTGPVSRDHPMRLYLLSPGVNRLLTVARLGCLAVFIFLLLANRWPPLPRRRPAAPVPAALLALIALAAPAQAQVDQVQRQQVGAANLEAETQPALSKELLEELKRRLTRPATCEPRCVTNPALGLRLGDGRMQLTAEVHVAADGSWALPGPLGSWAPSELRVDGAPAVAVAHLEDGFLHLRLSRGVHRVEAEGPLPAGDTFTLAFAVPPRRAQATAPGWDVSGIRGDGPPEASVLFTRRLGTHAVAGAGEGRYAPWLEITRTIGFGVTWTVETSVRRLTPIGTPVAVRVPLLPGEAPTEADVPTEGGEAAISLASDEQETSWRSTLAQAPQITLTAPQGRPWSEVWRLQCSAIWPCAAAGLPPVSRFADGVLTPEYRPWPGEALTVSLRHPSGAEGQTLTIDSVRLASEPGTRLDRVTLLLQARCSREQPLVVRLPREAEIQKLTLDGRDRASRPDNGELRLTVPAGSHRIELRWQQPTGLGVFYSLPRVGLSVPAVNVTQQVSLPAERWLLLTRGPAWGPAVLFWPYLLFVVALGLLLGRVPGSPLAGRDWVLLGLGLSQLPALAALVVVGFVFALAHRAERPLRSPAWFDLLQLTLAGWALASALVLYLAVHTGLLLRPDMQVAGGNSSETSLVWFSERVSGELPSAGVVSVPLWGYRILMLLWALWLARGLVRGVAWGWAAFGAGGYWRRLLPRKSAASSPSSAPAAGSASAATADAPTDDDAPHPKATAD